jgi:RHS repeat-associated protein
VRTGSASRRLLYDGVDRIAEYDGAGGALLGRIVHGPAVDEPLVVYEGATRTWLYGDERGSVVAHAGDSGAVGQINTYGVWGEPGPANAGRFGFTGQAHLADTGLYHYKARVYSPVLGRFLQPDPIGEAGGINLYAYGLNDPVNLVDPDGLQSVQLPEVVISQPRPPANPGINFGAINANFQQQAFLRPSPTPWYVDFLRGASGGVRNAGPLLSGPAIPTLAAAAAILALSSSSTAGPENDEARKYLFRGERASRPPTLVFSNGFKSRGANMNLLRHAQGASDSGYIPTSRSLDIANQFAGKNGYIYVIRSARGIDVNAALGSKSPFPEQLEVAFPNYISGGEIYGVVPKVSGIMGAFVPNPGAQ